MSSMRLLGWIGNGSSEGRGLFALVVAIGALGASGLAPGVVRGASDAAVIRDSFSPAGLASADGRAAGGSASADGAVVIDMRDQLWTSAPARATSRSDGSNPRVPWDNDSAGLCIAPLTAAHIAGEAAQIAVPPPYDIIPALTTFIAHLGLKHCAPVLVVPPTLEAHPNTSNGCGFLLTQGTREDDVTDSVGFPFDPLQFFRSDLGVPVVAHYDTEVRVSLEEHSGIERGNSRIEFPVGNNFVRWRAHTMVSPVDGVFIYIPELPRRYEYLKPFIEAAVEAGLGGAELLFPAEPYRDYYNDQYQTVRVWDNVAPIFQATQTYFEIEADAPGGMKSRDLVPILRASFTVSDKCSREVKVNHLGIPPLVPVGADTIVQWSAKDPGPNSANGAPNETILTQTVRIKDETPPLIDAPADIVREASAPLAVDIGAPKVFDIADLDVQVTNDAPALFPLGETLVTWTATDHSGNSATDQQRVTVKQPGTNTAPEADSQVGPDALQAISFEPLEVTLTGFDADGDHLDFAVTGQPAHGSFVAPLLPYFVTDYRIERTADRNELQGYCDRRESPPVDFVTLPRYITVLDDGTMYVLDEYYYCSQGDLITGARLAMFAADGSFVTHRTDVDSAVNTLSISPLGEPYYTRKDRLRIFAPDLQSSEVFFLDAPTPGAPPFLVHDFGNTTIDSQGVLYVTDRTKIYAFDRYDLVNDNTPNFLGVIADNSYFGSVWDLTVDSEDNLYVGDRDLDRIFKFAASRRVPAGLEIGGLIGWLGRCSDGTGCDIANERSLGYSCTPATCVAATTGGSAPGQFDNPLGLAIDPSDNLYVADRFNDRVQRFTPEGFFGGQAKAAQGANGFVLGAFDAVEDVSVNSRHFYVLDRDQDLLHIFQTTPLKELGPDWATVDYRSDNNFVGTDSFEFETTDGLATSSPGQVDVVVTRNFRRPFAVQGVEATTLEDQPVVIELLGSDPDVPLDTLSYTITRPPSFGSLSGGTGALRTYTPSPDFNGSDSFEFAVGDGAFTSEPALVGITVLPANDPPSVVLPGALRAGVGFPLPLAADVFDPDEEDSHSLSLSWGDGTMETEGAVDEDGNVTGPLLVEGPDGQGKVLAETVYYAPGSYPITLCVNDDGGGAALTGCQTVQVDVSPMVDLAVRVEPVSEPSAGRRVYDLVIDNNLGANDAGLRATSIELVHTMIEKASLLPVSFPGCSATTSELRCSFASLGPGQSITLRLEAQVLVTSSLEVSHETRVTSTEPDAVPTSNYRLHEAGLLFGATFEGGDLGEWSHSVP